MKPKDVSKLVAAGEIEQLIGQLFSGIPFIFRQRPSEYHKFCEHFAAALNCDPKNVTIVGSGRFGFSLAPHKFGRPFHDRSDIDVVIVDTILFDTAWLELIRYDIGSVSLSSDVAQSLQEHRRNNVFWGYLEPYNLKTALSLYSKIWFPMIASLGFFHAAVGRTVKARVYRTWDHAKNYHRYGIRKLHSDKGN